MPVSMAIIYVSEQICCRDACDLPGGKFNPNEWAQPHIHAFLDSHGLQEMPAWLVAELPSKRRYTIENKNEPGKFLSAHGVADSGYGLPGGANLVVREHDPG